MRKADAAEPAHIREACSADAPAIFALLHDLAEYECLLDEFHATEAGIRTMLADGTAQALIAEFEGRPVGLALYYRTALSFLGRSGLWLEDLFVLPAHRGQGIGRALLRQMARITVAGGHAALEWNVLDWNETAIAVYRAIGATAREGWTDQRLHGQALHALAGEASHG